MSVINTDPNTLMIRCECHGHVLEVTNDASGVGDGIEPDFYFTVWNQTPFPFSFRNRLHLIWQLICGKNLEGGDVIVSLSDTQAVIDFLCKKLMDNKILLEQHKNETKCQREQLKRLT